MKTLLTIILSGSFAFSQAPVPLLNELSVSTFEERLDVLKDEGFSYHENTDHTFIFETPDVQIFMDTLENSIILRLPFELSKYSEIQNWLLENAEATNYDYIEEGFATAFMYKGNEWILFDYTENKQHSIIILITVL